MKGYKKVCRLVKKKKFSLDFEEIRKLFFLLKWNLSKRPSLVSDHLTKISTRVPPSVKLLLVKFPVSDHLSLALIKEGSTV